MVKKEIAKDKLGESGLKKLSVALGKVERETAEAHGLNAGEVLNIIRDFREKEVMVYVDFGFSYTEIGEMLNLEESAVRHIVMRNQ